MISLSVQGLTGSELDAANEVIKAAYNSQQHTNALRLLARLGFTQRRALSHMRRGKPIQRGRQTMIYGQTSLGFG